MRADNRYKVALWHHALGVAKIETFYGTCEEKNIISEVLMITAVRLYEKDGWEVVKVKYDGPSLDFNNF